MRIHLKTSNERKDVEKIISVSTTITLSPKQTNYKSIRDF